MFAPREAMDARAARGDETTTTARARETREDGTGGGVDLASVAMFHPQQMMMANPEAMRAAMERNAALVAMGPSVLAQYAAYLAYAQSQHARGVMGMMPDRAVPFMGAGYPYGALVYGAEATSAMMGGGGGGGKSRARTARGERAASERERKRARKASAPPKPKVKVSKTCVNCKSTDTPFWRKEKGGDGSLCNACGLYQAKNAAPRPAMLWKKPGTSASEEVTNNSDKTTEVVPSTEHTNEPAAAEKETESVDAAAGGTSDDKMESGNSE